MNFYVKDSIPWNSYKLLQSLLTTSSFHSENKIKEIGQLLRNPSSNQNRMNIDKTYQLPRKIAPQMILTLWNLITYPLRNIKDDEQEVSVSNVEKEGLLTIVCNIMTAIAPITIDPNKDSTNSGGQDNYWPSKLLLKTQTVKGLILPSLKLKS